jgi:DNA-binding MarR family transcriptional regulator
MVKENLALVLESWSKVLQDIGSGLYLKAFSNKGMAALSLVQFRYFELIARQPGITPGELSKVMKVTKPTVANTLAGLERRGLVRKEKSDSDGRVLHVFLAEEALEIAEYRRSMYRLMAVRIGQALTKDECVTIARIMKKALSPLSKIGGARKDNGKELA